MNVREIRKEQYEKVFQSNKNENGFFLNSVRPRGVFKPPFLSVILHFHRYYPFLFFSFFHQITFVDFIMYELLDQHLQLSDICLKDVKNLQEFQKRFESLEPIQRYMSSPRFMRSPINNKMAKFGTQ